MTQTLFPVIKWSGSKRSQATRIVSLFPKFERYYEPFLGGGSIMIRTGAKDAICGDICKPLVDLWNLIRDNPSKVIDSYESRWTTLQSDGYQVYYKIRDRFNHKQDPHDLLFLSRTCVNGLIRFNQRGEFNNSFHHTRPGINPQKLGEMIDRWSNIIQKFKFIHGHYSSITRNVTPCDFVYLDPPYFNTVGRYYGTIAHDEFINYLEYLTSENIKFALSFDGMRGSKKYFADLPKNLFRRHFLLDSGNSSFRKVMDQKIEKVKESIYLNF